MIPLSLENAKLKAENGARVQGLKGTRGEIGRECSIRGWGEGLYWRSGEGAFLC